MAGFDRLGLCDELCLATQDMGWSLPTNVQDESIPLILGGGDVMIAAETGSGKTGAFALPILQLVHEAFRGKGQVAPDSKSAPSIAVTDAFRLNASDRDPFVAIGEDGLLTQSRDERKWGGTRANKGVTTGKYYFEATVTDEGLCRVGWASLASTYNLGTDNQSFGFGGTGKKSFQRKFDDYGESFGLNDTIGCLLDRNTHTISFTKNGVDLGKAFDIPPQLHAVALFPAVVLKNAEIVFNFGDSPFKAQVPEGYTALADASHQHCRVFSSDTVSQSQQKSGAALQRSVMAVVLEPTRELALQVHEEIEKFKGYLVDPPVTHDLFIGGMNFNQMVQSLKSGVNIAIGTPGRLVDLVKSGKMNLSDCRYFVLDEADRLLDTGVRKDILMIYNKLNQDMGVQSVICSATLHSPEISSLSSAITYNPTWVDLKGKDSVPDTVDHAVVRIDPRADKQWDGDMQPPYQTDGVHKTDEVSSSALTDESLSEGIKRLKPHYLLEIINAFKMEQALIFCRTQVDCDNLEEFLVAAGGGRKFRGKAVSGVEGNYSCVVLHSGRRQQERTANLNAFRDGDVKFMICTDVAARGIDIAELPYVINMTLPAEAEEYIHRVGRVGRADAVGLAISFVATTKEKVWFHKCNRKDRGRGCTRTNLVERGGCTIWYNEPNLLSAIEKRLGGVSIPALDNSNLVKGREEFMKAAAEGKLKEDPVSEATAKHAEILKPAVQQLAELEVMAQQNYLRFSKEQKWRQRLKK